MKKAKTNGTLTIEKGIPIPGYSRLSPITATVRAMKVGDSFKISPKSRNNIGSIFRRVGFNYATRAVSDTEIRVWRIK